MCAMSHGELCVWNCKDVKTSSKVIQVESHSRQKTVFMWFFFCFYAVFGSLIILHNIYFVSMISRTKQSVE